MGKSAGVAALVGLAVSMAALALVPSAAAADAIEVHTSDFIADGSRTNFAGFESLPWVGYTPLHIEDGIRIEQVNPSTSGIYSGYNYWGNGSDRSWYPNGGDYGYTDIQKVDGTEFFQVGFLRGSGFYDTGALKFYYELWNDGTFVQSGVMSHSGQAHYLGFSGGGFDEIRMRDAYYNDVPGFGGYNALAIDSIEVGAKPVPEPGTLVLLGSGVMGLIAASRRRRASKVA